MRVNLQVRMGCRECEVQSVMQKWILGLWDAAAAVKVISVKSSEPKKKKKKKKKKRKIFRGPSHPLFSLKSKCRGIKIKS
jgi:hypothetical protein